MKKRASLNQAIAVPKKPVARTLYKKVGKNYIPVGKDDIITAHVPGDYLVRVREHSRKMTGRVIPLSIDWAKVEIVLDEAADAVCVALREASSLEVANRPLTKKEIKAWKVYKKMVGAESLTLTRKSAWEISQAAVKCLRENLRGKSKCPEGCLETYAER